MAQDNNPNSPESPPVRMARTQEELNPPPKPKRAYKKKSDKPEEISNAEWAKRMSQFIGIRSYTPMTLEEVATVLGCTREWVRQIEVSAIKKLRTELERRRITEFRDIFEESHHSSGYIGSAEKHRED